MSKLIGIIAEDMSDVEVIKILLKKIATRRFATVQFVGKGCGPLKRKIPGWCAAFKNKGVKSVLIVHDLDRNNALELHDKLSKLVPDLVFAHTAIVIAIEELEAWLLSDMQAIKDALNLVSIPRVINHPENIASPKEHLGDIIKTHSKGRLKIYSNTIHNSLIANKIEISELSKCVSFSKFNDFAQNAIG